MLWVPRFSIEWNEKKFRTVLRKEISTLGWMSCIYPRLFRNNSVLLCGFLVIIVIITIPGSLRYVMYHSTRLTHSDEPSPLPPHLIVFDFMIKLITLHNRESHTSLKNQFKINNWILVDICIQSFTLLQSYEVIFEPLPVQQHIVSVSTSANTNLSTNYPMRADESLNLSNNCVETGPDTHTKISESRVFLVIFDHINHYY